MINVAMIKITNKVLEISKFTKNINIVKPINIFEEG